jgi:GT2 family glycosyltransferase
MPLVRGSTPVEIWVDKFPSRERSASATLAPRVSAIVVAGRGRGKDARLLDLCLRSALAEPWIDDVVVVDYCATAEVASALRALQADRRDVKLVDGAGAATAVAAANLGAAHAHGRWLLFLDGHVVLQRGAVARMVAAGGEAQAPWIVGGRLSDTRGRARQVTRTGALNAWSALAVALRWGGPTRRKQRDEPAKVAAVSGAFMLVPRSDFQSLGGFDEAFITDGADLDLCRRALDVGGNVLVQPAAAGVQFEGARLKGRKQAQGLALFAFKCAKTPVQRAFAMIARPALGVLLALTDFVRGHPPLRR